MSEFKATIVIQGSSNPLEIRVIARDKWEAQRMVESQFGGNFVRWHYPPIRL